MMQVAKEIGEMSMINIGCRMCFTSHGHDADILLVKEEMYSSM